MKKFRPAQKYNFVTGGFDTIEPKPKRTRQTSTTNQLTKAVENYITLCGGYAMRINVAGFYRPDVGYIKSGSTVGVPDVIAVIGGRYVGIEVKTGDDVQSQAQKKAQERTEQAKGVYLIARDFDSFKSDFDSILKKF